MTTIDKFRWKKDKKGNTIMYIDESGIGKRKKKSDQNAVAELTREGLYKENKWLWEENKKLKLENAKLKDRIITDENFEEKLDKENKNLKEKVETLELWLDNKEKLNEEYRKQIDKLRTDNIYEEGLYD